jgi:hypothetical protein
LAGVSSGRRQEEQPGISGSEGQLQTAQFRAVVLKRMFQAVVTTHLPDLGF